LSSARPVFGRIAAVNAVPIGMNVTDFLL